jgi:hypothetical protein
VKDRFASMDELLCALRGGDRRRATAVSVAVAVIAIAGGIATTMAVMSRGRGAAPAPASGSGEGSAANVVSPANAADLSGSGGALGADGIRVGDGRAPSAVIPGEAGSGADDRRGASQAAVTDGHGAASQRPGGAPVADGRVAQPGSPSSSGTVPRAGQAGGAGSPPGAGSAAVGAGAPLTTTPGGGAPSTGPGSGAPGAGGQLPGGAGGAGGSGAPVARASRKPEAWPSDPGHLAVVRAAIQHLGYDGFDPGITATEVEKLSGMEQVIGKVKLGMLERRAGRCATAVPLFTEARQVIPANNHDASKWRARASIAQGLCALATGQAEEANQLAMSGWVEGNQDEVRFIMALALYEKGEMRTAQAMFLDVSQRANPAVRAAVQTWLDKTGLTLP